MYLMICLCIHVSKYLCNYFYIHLCMYPFMYICNYSYLYVSECLGIHVRIVYRSIYLFIIYLWWFNTLWVLSGHGLHLVVKYLTRNAFQKQGLLEPKEGKIEAGLGAPRITSCDTAEMSPWRGSWESILHTSWPAGPCCQTSRTRTKKTVRGWSCLPIPPSSWASVSWNVGAGPQGQKGWHSGWGPGPTSVQPLVQDLLGPGTESVMQTMTDLCHLHWSLQARDQGH